MTPQEVHYQFKLGLDRIDSLQNPDLNPAEIDWLINEAALIFLKQRYSKMSNLKGQGFEESQKRIDDLSSLVIKYPEQPAITPISLGNGVYRIDLDSLSFPYFALLALKVDLSLENGCVIEIIPNHTNHDSYRVAFKDPFNKPSEHNVLYNFGKNPDGGSSIFFYTTTTTMLVAVYPEYLKLPKKQLLGTYEYIDGTLPALASLDFPESAIPEIIDIAVQIAALNTQNPEYIQLKQAKININE